ncbi:hemerythrin domain-containing protein [Streptomyces adustus]
MVVVHRVFRRESALLPRLVRAVGDGDTDRAARIAAHLDDYLTGLHRHHAGKDELIWPLLRERAPDAELVGHMEQQHQDIDRGLAVVSDWLPAWRREANHIAREELALALVEHRSALLVHLDDEERLVLPLVAEHLTVAEWDLVGRRRLEGLPKEKLLIALGAILEEATPQERAYFLGKAPLLVRLLRHTLGRRQYAAVCRVVRAPPDEGARR